MHTNGILVQVKKRREKRQMGKARFILHTHKKFGVSSVGHNSISFDCAMQHFTVSFFGVGPSPLGHSAGLAS